MDRITPEALYQATVHWLWDALLEEETANEKEKKEKKGKKERDPSGFVSHLEAFKGCKWISIHFPVYKNQVVLTELLNCWTKQCAFFFFLNSLSGEAVCAGREGCKLALFPWGGRKVSATSLSRGVLSGAGGCWGAARRPAARTQECMQSVWRGAACLFSKPLYLRLLVRLVLREFS